MADKKDPPYIFQHFTNEEISEAEVAEKSVYSWIMPDMRSNPDTLSDFGLRPGPVSNPNDPIPQLQRPTRFYFYKVYDRTPNIEVSEAAQFPQFTVTYGHVDGSGSASGSENDPTEAIYRQYVNSALEREDREEDGNGDFKGFGFSDTPHFYAVNLNRDVQKSRIRPGQWELTLSYDDTDSTRNVKLVDVSTADSSVLDGPTKEIKQAKSQEIEVAPGDLDSRTLDQNPRSNKTYGYVYPAKGIIALNPDALVEDAAQLESNLNLSSGELTSSIEPDLGSPSTPNHELLFNTIVNGKSFRMQSIETSVEKIFSTTVRQEEFNYSLNPTYSDSNGNITFPASGTYFTTIGLYNDNYELLAVAKIANPQRKQSRDSASIDVGLEF